MDIASLHKLNEQALSDNGEMTRRKINAGNNYELAPRCSFQAVILLSSPVTTARYSTKLLLLPLPFPSSTPTLAPQTHFPVFQSAVGRCGVDGYTHAVRTYRLQLEKTVYGDLLESSIRAQLTVRWEREVELSVGYWTGFRFCTLFPSAYYSVRPQHGCMQTDPAVESAAQAVVFSRRVLYPSDM